MKDSSSVSTRALHAHIHTHTHSHTHTHTHTHTHAHAHTHTHTHTHTRTRTSTFGLSTAEGLSALALSPVVPVTDTATPNADGDVLISVADCVLDVATGKDDVEEDERVAERADRFSDVALVFDNALGTSGCGWVVVKVGQYYYKAV